MAYEIKSIDKIKTDKYQLRYEGGPWADIFLEDWDLGKSGKVLINSDWGTWESSWGAMGDDIRDFLLRIDKGYTMKNLAHGGVNGHQRYFDEEATIKEIKKGILATRVTDHKRKEALVGNDSYHWPSWSKDEARDAWYDIDELFGWDIDSANSYFHAVNSCRPKWAELWSDPPCPPCVTGYHPRFVNFMDNIWPEFLDVIRKEKETAPAKS